MARTAKPSRDTHPNQKTIQTQHTPHRPTNRILSPHPAASRPISGRVDFAILTANDTYAVAAYILSLNGILPPDGKSNRDGFVPEPEFDLAKLFRKK